MEAGDGGLCGFRVGVSEQRPFLFPVGKFVVLIVLTRFVVLWIVFVIPSDVVVELAMDVELMFQSLRYFLTWISTVPVTVFHRCLLFNIVFT